ncbi:hypothetical protein CHLNCDRAFT_143806 [Chlorella variabilis]|uniref:Fe2OG dioxygenase domain-containing protein n=1 Tax=Chlorella variabilis TaxID=554065 RepID=E1ZAH2_CHLVA|nr:hypothetical protein CHLNCDRAFT_143806 [Chlorella variabilis]EFN57062.1 hypothetical protein CHLNCDRAFT_143806 [Chlorella variabilis]|eukprot:XP_005849164.1 hypothetical protein CHLNCDRAFT_143806 [Chlorella variabilis]
MGGQQGKGEAPGSHPAGLATPEQPRGSDRGARGAGEDGSRSSAGVELHLGILEVSEGTVFDCAPLLTSWCQHHSLGAGKGGFTWRLRLSELLPSLEACGGGGRGSGGEPRARGSQCTSLPFRIPRAALPAACRGLVEQHRWCLVCEAAAAGRGRRGPTLGVSLRWLGGPSYPATSGASLCCEFLLAARCLSPPSGAQAEAGADQERESGWRHVAADRRWLRHAFHAGQPLAGLPALPAAGRLAAGEAAGLELEAHIRFEGVAMHVQAPLPGLVVHEAPLLLKVSEEPCLLLADAFLSPEECGEVRALGAPHMKRSKVSAGDETPLRTSWGTFLTGPLAQQPVAARLEGRVRQLAALACEAEGRRALQLGEATQIVRYDPGQFYALHLDNRAGDSSRRAATVMIYISDVEAGGATHFPRSCGYPLERALEACAAGARNEPAPPPGACPPAGHSPRAGQPQHPPGLWVQPREGRAVIFWSRLPGGGEDKASIHEAERVEAGTKWICTRWCREQDPA